MNFVFCPDTRIAEHFFIFFLFPFIEKQRHSYYALKWKKILIFLREKQNFFNEFCFFLETSIAEYFTSFFFHLYKNSVIVIMPRNESKT